LKENGKKPEKDPGFPKYIPVMGCQHNRIWQMQLGALLLIARFA
jgi:hypothetical protein